MFTVLFKKCMTRVGKSLLGILAVVVLSSYVLRFESWRHVLYQVREKNIVISPYLLEVLL